MGAIDDYLRGQVTSQLRPGEHVLGMGLVRKPFKINPFGVPQKYEEWFAASTNHRLLLLQTEASGVLELTPRAMCTATEEWVYADLREVTVDQVAGVGGGIFFGLVPHEGLGPRDGGGARFDVFPKVIGLDSHAEFFGSFPRWLQGQVAAGAFPMDETRRAQLAAIQQQKQAASAEQERQRAENAEARRQAIAKAGGALKSRALPIAGGVLLVAALGLLATAAYFYVSRADFWRTSLKSDKAAVARAKKNLDEAKEDGNKTKIADYEDEVKKLQKGFAMAEDKISEYETLGFALGGGGALALIGGAVLLVIGMKKKPAT